MANFRFVLSHTLSRRALAPVLEANSARRLSLEIAQAPPQVHFESGARALRLSSARIRDVLFLSAEPTKKLNDKKILFTLQLTLDISVKCFGASFATRLCLKRGQPLLRA